MIKKICFYTLSYSPNKKAMLDYIEKIFPSDVEVFLFVPKDSKGMYKFARIKVVDTKCNKINSMFELRGFCNRENIDLVGVRSQIVIKGR